MQKIKLLLAFTIACLPWLNSPVYGQKSTASLAADSVAMLDSTKIDSLVTNPKLDSLAVDTAVSPVDGLAIDTLEVDSTGFDLSSWVEEYRFTDSSFHIALAVDVSRLVWHAIDPTIRGVGYRVELFRKPWGLDLGYIYEENKTKKSQYSLNEKGEMYFVGIHLMNNYNTWGVGYAQTYYQRFRSTFTYYSPEWKQEFTQLIDNYTHTLHSYRFYDRIRIELFANFYLSLGATLDLILNYDLYNNIPLVWIPGMTIEWSRNFVSRLNFSYSIEYRL